MVIWIVFLILLGSVKLDSRSSQLQAAFDCREALAKALLLGYPTFDESHVLDNSGKG